MTWRVVALGAVLAIGCDRVFQLDRNIDAAGPQCPAPAIPGGPEVDDDGDTRLNGADNCPLVANVDQHDEDGDLLGDSCDLCPTAGEDRDADCDGIGTSCDPDDTRPDERQFFGFANENGIITSNPPTTSVTVTGDVLRVDKDTPGNYGSATAIVAVPQSGTYETRFTITGVDAAYHDVILRFGTTNENYPTAGYFLRVSRSALDFGSFLDEAPTQFVQTPVSGLAPGTYTLRVVVTGSSAIGTVVGGANVMATLDGGMRFPPLSQDPAASRFGVLTSGADVDFEYLVRVGPALL